MSISGHIVGMTIGGETVKKAYYNGNLVFDDTDVNIDGAYVTFTSSATFTLEHEKTWDGTLQYSTNTTTWKNWDGTAISSAKDKASKKYKLYLRGKKNTTLARVVTTGVTEVCEGSFIYTGNATYTVDNDLLYLLDYVAVANGEDVEMADYCFAFLFNGNTLLTSCSAPLTTVVLPKKAYNGMFYRCTSLTTGPEIQAEVLGMYSLYQMFAFCTSLATLQTDFKFSTVHAYACKEMFAYSGIRTAPNFGTTMSLMSYIDKDYVPNGEWFYRMYAYCTSLTTAPQTISVNSFPAFYGCADMFISCSALTTGSTIVCPGNIGQGSFKEMYRECSSLVTPGAIILGGKELGSYACEFMYQLCTSLEKVPTFSGFKMYGENCCYGMFDQCSSLNQVYSFNTLGAGITSITKGWVAYMFNKTKVAFYSTTSASIPATATNDFVLCKTTMSNSTESIRYSSYSVYPNTMYKTDATIISVG